jgi:predicted ATP-grasp superfamily ATP-dependent carboligase
MLARSAVRAGLRPLALDLYADEDTRAYAERCERVAAGPIGFDARSLLEAAERLAPAGSGPALVYGSGMDVAPDLLEALARGRMLYGNPPAVVRLLKTPDTFFDLLRRLAIPFPEIRDTPPPDPEHWLIKAGCGEGGKGVRFCARTGAEAGEYYQRRLPGLALSALFLADGHTARIIGFNTLWTAAGLLPPLPLGEGGGEGIGQPFLFAGAINRAELSPAQREQVQGYLARLVPAAALRGLNSLDFMLDGATCRVLEVNPRPSATLALYDEDFPDGLLAAHIRAVQGDLGAAGAAGAPARAFRAVFAQAELRIPEVFAWPEWCADRPPPGSLIGAGQPVCTVTAEGGGRRETEALIRHRAAELERRLAPIPP